MLSDHPPRFEEAQRFLLREIPACAPGLPPNKHRPVFRVWVGGVEVASRRVIVRAQGPCAQLSRGSPSAPQAAAIKLLRVGGSRPANTRPPARLDSLAPGWGGREALSMLGGEGGALPDRASRRTPLQQARRLRLPPAEPRPPQAAPARPALPRPAPRRSSPPRPRRLQQQQRRQQ